jgi:hypothetical protein
MSGLKIFVIFHVKINEECYENLTPEEFSHFIFVAANEAIPKVYPTDPKYNIIKEWELPIYDPELQKQKYDENSVIRHVYLNKLHEGMSHVGFCQYDMYFKKNSINNVKTEMHPDSVYCMVACPWFLYESNFPDDGEFFGDIVMDMFKYFPDATFSKKNLFPLCNAYILPVGFLDTIMPWIIQLDSKVLTASRSSRWGPGHYLEHIMGIIISGLYSRFASHWSGVIHPITHDAMHHLKHYSLMDRVKFIRESTASELSDPVYIEKLMCKLGFNNEVLHEQPQIVIDNPGGLHIWQYPNQFSKYIVFMKQYAISSYIEIGCRRGGTFILTTEYLKIFNEEINSVAVDIEDFPSINEYVKLNHNTKFMKINSQSQEFKEMMNTNKYDVIFIDGDHSYEGVTSDYNTCKESGSIFVFHDISSYACPGVVKFWNQLKFREKDEYDFFEFTEQYDEVYNKTHSIFLGIGVAVKKTCKTKEGVRLPCAVALDDLTTLAEKYGSDKCPSILHTYTPVYNTLFKDIRTTTKSVLEIGIGHFEMMSEIVGVNYKPDASLRMWRDYFPNANIYSCDIVEKVIFQDERIYTWVADQCKPASLENLVTNIQETGTETIDIIVDDGSHVLSHQIISFITLWKYLSPGGLYIIEDMFHPHIDLLKPVCLAFPDVEDVGHYAGPVDTDGFVFFRKK